jgi:exodeoxyribonuclease III
MRLATWNVNSLNVRLEQVLAWLTHSSVGSKVDVLVLQETKLSDDLFPFQAFIKAGFELSFFGQKTYNGVALISRHPLSSVVKNMPTLEDPMARVISAQVLGVRVIGAYFPNGQDPLSDKFVYKMRWLNALHEWLEVLSRDSPPLALMGDFNITWDDADVWDPVGLKDTIHCTVQEREHFQKLLDLGLFDAHRSLHPEGKLFSWWDYREGGWPKNKGLRIDHILLSQSLQGRLLACEIDTEPRGHERPSDHAPVWVELSD